MPQEEMTIEDSSASLKTVWRVYHSLPSIRESKCVVEEIPAVFHEDGRVSPSDLGGDQVYLGYPFVNLFQSESYHETQELAAKAWRDRKIFEIRQSENELREFRDQIAKQCYQLGIAPPL